MTLQITDPKTLRKLLKRVEEMPDVKSSLELLAEHGAIPATELEKLLEAKKVKENQNLTALLKEILEPKRPNWIDKRIEEKIGSDVPKDQSSRGYYSS